MPNKKQMKREKEGKSGLLNLNIVDGATVDLNLWRDEHFPKKKTIFVKDKTDVPTLIGHTRK